MNSPNKFPCPINYNHFEIIICNVTIANIGRIVRTSLTKEEEKLKAAFGAGE
jgi:hypothetical protein